MDSSLEARKFLKALWQADRIRKAQAWLNEKPRVPKQAELLSADELLTRARQEHRRRKELNIEPYSRYKEQQRLKEVSGETRAIYQRKYDYIYGMTGDEELSRYMGLREIYRNS